MGNCPLGGADRDVVALHQRLQAGDRPVRLEVAGSNLSDDLLSDALILVDSTARPGRGFRAELARRNIPSHLYDLPDGWVAVPIWHGLEIRTPSGMRGQWPRSHGRSVLRCVGPWMPG